MAAIMMSTVNTRLTYFKPNNCSWHSDMNAFKLNFSSYRSRSTNGLIACAFKPETVLSDDTIATRRSGNYKPSIWDFEFIQSLNSENSGETYSNRVSELKSQLSMMLEDAHDPFDQLKLIDDLQGLGVSYHFEAKIKQILTTIYEQKYLKIDTEPMVGNLYDEALQFRLLRQHGFVVSQDVFESFKNEKGGYKSSLTKDTKGLLQLYEASHMSMEGENTLEEAREFAIIYLKNYLEHDHDHTVDPDFAQIVHSALELPLHWRVQRPHARSFINTYERRPDANKVVLEFAKLDFNIVQATYQEELKDVSRWWRRTCIAEKLPFARDRVVECYFWTNGFLFEPQYRFFRVMCAKVNSFITVIDDIYDVYGTLEELEMFTDVVQRWDIEAVDKLPHYMQICFSALNNFINDMAHEVLKEQGFLIIPYLRKSWRDLCNAYLKEAKWYSQGYTPTVEEYIEHGWVSISVPTIVTHALFLVANPIEKDVVEHLYKYHDIIRWSGIILRLADDLGTSKDEMERGDVPKLIQCYMAETGASEAEAEEFIRFMIRKTWKKMNKETVEEVEFPRSLVEVAANAGRMAQYMYQYGDGHGNQENSPIKYRIESLLFEPIG